MDAESPYSGISLINIAEICFNTDKIDEGFGYLQKAMNLCEKKDLDNLPRIYYLLSFYYSHLRREDLAKAFILQS